MAEGRQKKRGAQPPPTMGQRSVSKTMSAAKRGDQGRQAGMTKRGGGVGQGGPTPDASMRQKVLNRTADNRRETKEASMSGGKFSQGGGGQEWKKQQWTPEQQAAWQQKQQGGAKPPPTSSKPLPGSEAFRALSRPEQIQIEKSLGGGPGSGKSNDEIAATAKATAQADALAAAQGMMPRALGTPPAGAAPPPGSGPMGNMLAGATGAMPPPTAKPQEQSAQTAVANAAGGQVPSGETAQWAKTQFPPGSPEQADAVRGAAKQELSQGQMPEPPGQMDQEGNFQPDPSMSPQENAETIQAQQEAMVAQQRPEPPMPKSPLGADSPIEQADSQGKLRAGQRHHLRALGMSTGGMDPKTAKEFERKAVRDMDLFGEYPGMDDPHAPPPPIRPGKHSINPMTGQWVQPEGQVSILDRFGGGVSGPGGSNSELSVNNIMGRR